VPQIAGGQSCGGSQACGGRRRWQGRCRGPARGADRSFSQSNRAAPVATGSDRPALGSRGARSVDSRRSCRCSRLCGWGAAPPPADAQAWVRRGCHRETATCLVSGGRCSACQTRAAPARRWKPGTSDATSGVCARVQTSGGVAERDSSRRRSWAPPQSPTPGQLS
jgi:hypothetical protein